MLKTYVCKRWYVDRSSYDDGSRWTCETQKFEHIDAVKAWVHLRKQAMEDFTVSVLLNRDLTESEKKKVGLL